MSAGEHALMQNAADENAVSIRPVDYHVPIMLHAAISPPNPIARPSHTRSSRQSLKAAHKTIHVAIGLFQTPGVHGVVGNLD
jgi:hypothetical protein